MTAVLHPLRGPTALALAALLWACGDSDPAGPADDSTPELARIVVDPVSASIGVEDTLRLSATTMDQDGVPMEVPVTWQSLSPEIATVDPAGLVVGLAPGFAHIRASAGTISGEASLTVGPPPELAVLPDSLVLALGERQRLAATVTNALTDEVLWSSSDSSSVWVGPDGTIVRVGAHGATITAVLAAHPHIAVEIRVTPSRDLEIFPARPVLAVGDRLPLLASVPKPLLWEVMDTAVVFPEESGIMVGRAVGTSGVRASSPPDPALAASDTILVVPPSTAVRISEIRGENGSVADGTLTGTVRVDVRLGETEAPAGVTKVELLLDGWVVADRTYLGGAGLWTAMVDTRGFPDGPHRITARLIDEDDALLAQAAGVGVVVGNP